MRHWWKICLAAGLFVGLILIILSIEVHSDRATNVAIEPNYCALAPAMIAVNMGLYATYMALCSAQRSKQSKVTREQASGHQRN